MGGTGMLCQALLLSLIGTIGATLEGSCPVDPRVQERKPVQILIHEQFNIQLNTIDIALVQLDIPAHCGNVVQTACLPHSNESPIQAPESCIVTGWEFRRGKVGLAASVVQEAKVTVIDLDKCNETDWYHGVVHSNNLCISSSDENMDTCQGDRGGPLMCKDNETKTYVVHGIASWAVGCARTKLPGLYTSTWHFLKWITSKIDSGTNVTSLPSAAETLASASLPYPEILGRRAAQKLEEDFSHSSIPGKLPR